MTPEIITRKEYARAGTSHLQLKVMKMKQTRRRFLKTSALAGLSPLLPQAAFAQSQRSRDLVAATSMLQLAPDVFPQTEVWSYDGVSPGPEIRLAQGARVQKRLVNNLPEGTSVHWHGIRIDNAMDGVAGLTQDPAQPGETFDYDFQVPDAGTYWYHAHSRSYEQVGRGLYGPLIVEEAVAPDVDRDEVLVIDDWRLDGETAALIDSFEDAHDRSHAGREGNYFTTNSRPDYALDVKQGERLRLRVINAANGRIFSLVTAGLDGWVMAYDGMPLETPEKLDGVFLLAPGQRVDLFVDVIAEQGESAYLARVEDDQGYALAALVVTAISDAEPRGAPTPLPPNPMMDIPDLTDATPVTLNMAGGAMGNLQSANLDGTELSAQDLSDANMFWSFNGVVGLTDTPLARLSLNEVVRLKIVNDTAFAHAMHLHGMHFREVLEDGSFGPMRDTLLVFRGETREIAFVAHNPGKWLFHCHMLAHAAAGMITWLEIT